MESSWASLLELGANRRLSFCSHFLNAVYTREVSLPVTGYRRLGLMDVGQQRASRTEPTRFLKPDERHYRLSRLHYRFSRPCPPSLFTSTEWPTLSLVFGMKNKQGATIVSPCPASIPPHFEIETGHKQTNRVDGRLYNIPFLWIKQVLYFSPFPVSLLFVCLWLSVSFFLFV
jgi:hypothetical protein